MLATRVCALMCLLTAAAFATPQMLVTHSPRAAAGGCAGEDFTADSTLEAHYTFDADTWLDETANNNDLSENGTAVAVSTGTKAEGSGSADYTGADGDDYLHLDEASMAAGMPTESSASTTGSLTYAIRAYFDSGQVGTSTHVSIIRVDDWVNDGPQCSKNASDYIECSQFFNSWSWSSAVSASTWYHIAVRWDSADTAAEYSLVVDGTERANLDLDSHDVCDASTTNCLIFGANTSGTQYTLGYLDEALIFSSAVSNARLSDLATNGADGCGLP